MRLFGLLLLAQQAAAPAAEYPGSGSPTVATPRIDAVATIDGRLDETAWSNAARLTGFSQYEPVDGRPAAERTEVLVWYSPDAIHFGIIAHDRRPDAIRASVADRDRIDDDDHVTLYLDTFADRRRAFFFAVNPLGVQQDGVRSEGAVGAGSIFGGMTDKSPDYRFDSSGRLTEDGYIVEVRIPFKSLRYPGGEPQSWGIQVERTVQRTGYVDTWTDARRGNASFLAQSGTLGGLEGMVRGIVFETQPFVTAVANGQRAGSGGFERSPADAEVGVNARVGFSNISLDATINPDFSQVEADVGQVTINERFALFFPEKRPFFLEGIELFATPNQLVYTRQIANPIAGGKLTGKIGGLGVAHLTAIDDAGAEGEALFNVTRVRRDFSGNSVAGVTYTDRSVLGGGYNRVFAADVHHVFGGMYYAEAQLGGAWTRDDAAERGAPIWKLELDRTGRAWGFNYQVNGIGNGFVSRSGYVPRAGIVNAHAFNRFSLYGEEGALLENLTIFTGPTRLWRYGAVGPGDAIEGQEQLGTFIDLRGGWGISSSLMRRFFVLDPADYAGYRIAADGSAYHPLDEVGGGFAELTVNSPAYRRFDASATVATGRTPIFPEGAAGRVTRVRGSLGLRPHGSVRLAVSSELERIDRVRDASNFARTFIPRVQLEIQPTPAFFFRAIAEHRGERRAALVDARSGQPLLVDGRAVPASRLDALRLDLLLSYQPTPGTVAFLGYGGSLDSGETAGLSNLTRNNDGFFLKLAYRFRR